MIKFEEFTGGVFDTNAYLLRGPDGCVLIDAPQGADRHFANETIVAMILTHGHFDHIADAAAVHRRHGCSVAIHADSRAMLAERGFFSKWGFQMDVEPVEP
ncbi:MAG: MBL fold metallo-hydrolase, partial [Chthoniobacterales bacterium]